MSSVTTIKDLAEILDLSQSTISKALNDSSEISMKTKKKVKATADQMGYIPNHYARSLKSKMTKTIGVVVPNVVDDFFAKVLHGIEKEASKHGFTVLITFSNDFKKCECKHLQSLINHSVDGILISFSQETQRTKDYSTVQKIITYNTPIVMFDRINRELALDSVVIHDFQGAYQATQYLINSGCQKIAFLSPISSTSVGLSRKQGYLRALKDNKNSRFIPCYLKFRNYKKFREMFENTLYKNALDGILATDELSAIYAMSTIQQMGYKVPEEISVIGFTNGPMAQSSNPALSVVSQHAEQIGARSFQLLHRRITNDKSKIKNVVIDPELMLRHSTNPIQASELSGNSETS